MYIDIQTIPLSLRQQYLQHAVAPRPICLASTISAKGQVNLSPFSFFNLFSTDPPLLIFSPARRIRDNTIKHTLENVLEVPEVVIHIVDYEMVQQTSLSSGDYPSDIDEFIKAGFTPMSARHVGPPIVKESKISLECLVREVKALGANAGAGNLVICEVLCMHLAESVLDVQGMIDPQKLQYVARMGGDWYTVIQSMNLFEVEKPDARSGIGFDALPLSIRHSSILTGNHLGQLAGVPHFPDIDPSFADEKLTLIFLYFSLIPEEMEQELHHYAATLLGQGRVGDAWQVLLALP